MDIISNLLAWKDKPPIKGQTILLTDTIKTDGRFMLHILASQYISMYRNNNTNDNIKSKKGSQFTTTQTQQSHYCPPNHNNSSNGKLIWISCTNETEKQIMKSINIYYDKIPSSSSTTKRISSSYSCFEIISVPKEIFSNTLEDDNYLYQLYLRIFPKIIMDDDDGDDSNKEVTIIIDDLSYLINFFGDRQVFGFIQELRNRSKSNTYNNKNNKNYLSALILRNCTEILHPSNLSSKVYIGTDVFIKDKGEIITDSNKTSSFEYLLYEITDGIIDIIPLSSGYYKDSTTHGRILFTECYNTTNNRFYNGFSNNVDEKTRIVSDPFIISFCYTDHGVRLNALRRNV